MAPACEEAGISVRTYRRWFVKAIVREDGRPGAHRAEPSNKLSTEERMAILKVCNEPEYASLPPCQIVPRLLDQGIFPGSESTYYRILKAHEQLHHRGRSLPPKRSGKPASHTARGPNEVWSWDITYLTSAVRGQFYYLYLFEDIYSRKIVGYEVYEKECGKYAAELLQRCLLREQCLRKPIVLHSDNGAPMKSLTMKAKLEEFGVLPSYSRPGVSNDNPYSESLFRTLKYRPEWPSSGFRTLSEARDWVAGFAEWYNNKHRHSRLNFVTPAQRHAGNDKAILDQRREILEQAKAVNPQRWSGKVRNCKPAGQVTLNPDSNEPPELTKAA